MLLQWKLNLKLKLPQPKPILQQPLSVLGTRQTVASVCRGCLLLPFGALRWSLLIVAFWLISFDFWQPQRHRQPQIFGNPASEQAASSAILMHILTPRDRQLLIEPCFGILNACNFLTNEYEKSKKYLLTSFLLNISLFGFLFSAAHWP